MHIGRRAIGSIAAVVVVLAAGIIIAPASSGAPDAEGCSAAPSASFAKTVKRVYDPQRWHRVPKKSVKRHLARGAACRGQKAVHRKAVRRWRRSRNGKVCGEPACNLRLGMAVAREAGYGRSQRSCFATLGFKESGWNERAINGSSGAGGIPQGLPYTKMGRAASPYRDAPDWRVALAQVRWMLLDYIRGRYGSPCSALSFHYAHNWY